MISLFLRLQLVRALRPLSDPLRISVFLFVFTLPFLPAINPTSGIDLASSRVFILLLFFGTIVLLKKGATPLKITWGEKVLFLFLCVAAISLFGAEEPLWGLRKLFVFVSIFPLFFVIRQTVRGFEDSTRLVELVTLSAFTVSLFGLFQYVSQYIVGVDAVTSFIERSGPFFYGNETAKLVVRHKSWLVDIGGMPYVRALGPFPDPHTFAFYIGMVIPFLIPRLLVATAKQGRDFFSTPFAKPIPFFLYTILLSALFFTFSRGAYLAFFASLGLVLALALFRIPLRPANLILVLGVVALIFFSLGRGFSGDNTVVGRLSTSFDPQEGSNLGRLFVWGVARDTIVRAPLFGVGIGNFPLVVDPSSPYRSPINTHNTYLDLWAEMGVGALILWVTLIFGTFINVFKMVLRKTSSERTMLGIGVIGSLTYFTVHSFFEVPIYSPTILPLFMFVLAIADSISDTTHKKSLRIPPPH